MRHLCNKWSLGVALPIHAQKRVSGSTVVACVCALSPSLCKKRGSPASCSCLQGYSAGPVRTDCDRVVKKRL
jgi:hypothetical protein